MELNKEEYEYLYDELIPHQLKMTKKVKEEYLEELENEQKL